MEVFLNIVIALVCMLFGYFIGAIPNGVLLGRLFFKKDPRDYGSHASGGTNASRVLGKKAGLIVILLDILKCAIAFWTVYAVITFSGLKQQVHLFDNGILYIWLTCLGVSIGHCWPVYIHFKGGKTVAVYMGATGGATWLMFILDHVIFFSVYLLSKKKKIVSYASLISGLLILMIVWLFAILDMTGVMDTSILSWSFASPYPLHFSWEEGMVTTLIYLILVLRHHQNIVRLRKGTEAPVNLFGK
jgi:glycerol-3-phosphate acyltransferase PlsY